MPTSDIVYGALLEAWDAEVEFFAHIHVRHLDKDLGDVNRLELYRQLLLAVWQGREVVLQ